MESVKPIKATNLIFDDLVFMKTKLCFLKVLYGLR